MLITKTLAALVFSYYFINVAQLPMKIKKVFKIAPNDRIKPFDCMECLSVWVALILFFIPDIVSNCLLVSFGAGFIATKFNK